MNLCYKLEKNNIDFVPKFKVVVTKVKKVTTKI